MVVGSTTWLLQPRKPCRRLHCYGGGPNAPGVRSLQRPQRTVNPFLYPLVAGRPVFQRLEEHFQAVRVFEELGDNRVTRGRVEQLVDRRGGGLWQPRQRLRQGGGFA